MRAFEPYSVDTRPLSFALSQGIIDKETFRKIASKKRIIEKALEKIIKSTDVKPFPPIVIVPEAIIDNEDQSVIHAKISLQEDKGHVYLAIELSGPSLLYLDESLLLGILAHEFLHYVSRTIDLKKQDERTEEHEQIVTGIIPNKEEMSVKERDKYYYSDPEIWFKDKNIKEKVSEADDKLLEPHILADKVLDLVKEGYPIKEFKRGSMARKKGEIWIHEKIIEKAREHELI